MAHVTIPDTSPRVQYTVGGTSTTDFSIPYAYFEDSDILVYVDATLKTLTTDYTITGTAVDEGYSGGTVVLNSGVTNVTVTLVRDVPVERVTDFPTNGPFNITQLNSELDRMTAQIQQNESLEDYFLKVADYDTYTDLTLPLIDDRKGTVLGFNATTGDPEAGPTIADVSSLASITADIATLADIEDGTDATDAIQTCATNAAAIIAAPTQASNAAASATAAATSATNAASSATAAASSATSASGSASTATTKASEASTSASNASTSASNASTSETNAASSASSASTSASTATTQATNAAASATAAAASATAAQAAVDLIESQYLGAQASAPTLDLNGDALTAGDWYFNTTDNLTYVYNGSSWQVTVTDVSGLVAKTGDTMTGNLSFGDNDKAIFGAGSDLQIYHTGTYSAVQENGTGTFYVAGSDLSLTNSAITENYLRAIENGAVTLYYDNSAKLATTSTGVSVTGTAVGTLTTDNDLSFDMNASNQFKCTPTANGTLTFTNITAGQSGNIFLVNSGGYAISAAATTYISAADLSAISTAGSYFLSYFSDGTNVMVSASAAVTSAGA